MRLLFVGSEEEYRRAIESREDAEAFSLLFCSEIPHVSCQEDFDAIVIPALRFLSLPCACHRIPIIVSGPSGMAKECLESGCSDFIREPWTEAELYARVMSRSPRRLDFGVEAVSVIGLRLIGPSGSICISEDAFSLLAILEANRGNPVPRPALATCIGLPSISGRAIDMRVARLRSYLRAVGAPEVAKKIHCSHGSYILTP